MSALDTSIWNGRAVTRQRSTEKQAAVFRCLYQFTASTQKLLAAMLGVDERGQYEFFARLRKTKLVETFKHDAWGNELIYRLTSDGMAHAAMLHGYPVLPPQRVAHQILAHDFTVQAAIGRRLLLPPLQEGGEPLPLMDYVSERRNGAPLNGKKPDALLSYSGFTVALEMELTHKNKARVYYNFLSHLKNIRDKHYSRVEYVFTSPQLCALYESKFLASEWPVYEVGRNNRLTMTPTPFELKPDHRRFFQFKVESGYFL